MTGGPLDSMASWPGRASVAVIGPDGPLESCGAVDARFAWASVTKLLTALTVLDAVAQGRIELDEPAGPPGATVRHLLAHASGVAPDGDAILSAPGRRRIYSNRGFELLAERVAERTGRPFADVLAERVGTPLGLSATALDGSPASGARGPLLDLASLAGALLRRTVLPPDLMAAATSVAFPGLSGVLPGFGRQEPCDWGLGFELRDGKSPHWTGAANSPATFGHFGRSGSFLWVDPVADLACVCLGDTDFGPWAAAAWPRLADDVLASYGQRQ